MRYNIPYEIKTAFMTVLLTTLTLGTKREMPVKKQDVDFKPKLSTFNTLSGMGMTHNSTYYVKAKPLNKIKNANDLLKIDSLSTANDLDSLNVINTAQESMDVKIIVGKQMVKYLYPDGSIEIRQGGTLPWRNKNPGALRVSSKSVGRANRFAVFASEEEGMQCIKDLLLSKHYRNLTLKSAIFKYAPPRENNTMKYQSDLRRMTGIDLSKKICDLTEEEMERVISTIKIIEGWRVGKITHVDAPQIVDTLLQQTR